MLIKLRVKTDARKESVAQTSADHFEVSVKEPAERNAANDRILEIFRARFPMKAIRLIKGHHSPSKILSVE